MGNTGFHKTRPLAMHQTHKTEMANLCELCGYKILEADPHLVFTGDILWFLESAN